MEKSDIIARGGLYNYSNPPPSPEIAKERLRELEIAAEKIKVQLELPDKDRDSKEQDSKSWRTRAKTALAYYRVEINYLRGFLGISYSPDTKVEALLLENVEWRLFLLGIVDQAVASGFVLRADQASMLAVIREKTVIPAKPA